MEPVFCYRITGKATLQFSELPAPKRSLTKRNERQLCSAHFVKGGTSKWPGADVQSNRSTTVSELKLELVAPFAPGLRLPLKCLRIKEAALQV
jgi:hypothetical protein